MADRTGEVPRAEGALPQALEHRSDGKGDHGKADGAHGNMMRSPGLPDHEDQKHEEDGQQGGELQAQKDEPGQRRPLIHGIDQVLRTLGRSRHGKTQRGENLSNKVMIAILSGMSTLRAGRVRFFPQRREVPS